MGKFISCLRKYTKKNKIEKSTVASNMTTFQSG